MSCSSKRPPRALAKTPKQPPPGGRRACGQLWQSESPYNAFTWFCMTLLYTRQPGRQARWRHARGGLRRGAIDHRLRRRPLIQPERAQQRLGLVGEQQRRALCRLEEALLHHVIEEAAQARVEAVHVEQRAGLVVQPELVPGPDLKQLLQRADAAWQRHERIRERGHLRLALV